MILVDTSVLSLAFRRKARPAPEPATVCTLRRLITENIPVAIPGIVLQEVLSGVRTAGESRRLQRILDGFSVILARKEDHIAASRIANTCIKAGVAVSAVDCLIAAMTIESHAWLLTAALDFIRMAPHCGLQLLD